MGLSQDDIYVLLQALKVWKEQLAQVVAHPISFLIPGRKEAVTVLFYITKLQYQLVVILQQIKHKE